MGYFILILVLALCFSAGYFFGRRRKMNRKVVIAIIAILSFAILFKIAVFDNVNLLCQIAGGLNDPSTAYYFTIERIYKIAQKRDIRKHLIEDIITGNNGHLHYLYMRILGVIGGNDAISCLMKIYIDHQDQDSGKSKSERYIIVNSLGLIGDDNVVPFLERIFDKHEGSLNSVIAGSLYLLTGEKYDFVNFLGEKQKFFVTEDLIQARQVILDTKGKKRKFEDMIILDKSLRPPGR